MNFNFNPHEYDDQLSPFGKKVLRTLLKQWNTERDRNNNDNMPALQRRRHNHAQNKVLTFEDHSSTPIVNQTHALNFEHSTAETPFEFPAVERVVGASAAPPAPPPPPRTYPRPVPTSAELVSAPGPSTAARPVEIPLPALPHFPNYQNLTRSDLITSINTIDCSNRNNNLQYEDFLSQDSIEKDKDTVPSDFINNPENDTANGKDTDVGMNIVNWDNMFDTELFSEADSSYKLQMQKPQDQKTNNSRPKNEHKTNAPITEAVIVDSEKDHKDQIRSEKKTSKRKVQTQVTEAIPKKVKKVVDRKPKKKPKVNISDGYSETVTNWLNNVDPKDIEDSIELVNHMDEKQTNTEVGKPEIVVERTPKTKPTKKVVQTQLANKGGVMKFGKPKACDGGTEASETASAAATVESITEENKFKEKKSKTKFVAPIKSQMEAQPVSEDNYEVVEFTDALISKNELDGTNKKEIVTVLLYSNGYCQLNEQQTEAPCVPEGLLLHLDEHLNIYLNGSQKHLVGSVGKVISGNTLVCFDGKAVLIFLANAFGLEFDTLDIMDTKIAGALLDADSPPESFWQLESALGLSASGAGGGGAKDNTYSGGGASSQGAAGTAPAGTGAGAARARAAGCAGRLRAAADALRGRLRSDRLWDLFVDVEMQLVPIVADMEWRGVRVDVSWLRGVDAALEACTARAAAACGAAAGGRPLQLHSAPQLRALLYDELRLHIAAGVHVRNTGVTGAMSTDETMLRRLAAGQTHPLPALILEHRRLHKAHATFVTGVLHHVRGGLVRPVWEQSAAATGRLASSAPNLQSVPKAPLALPAEADGGSGGAELRLRSAYVCAAGCVLLAADFRHVECRVFARAAHDAAMERALHAPDLFATLAADWLKKPVADVSVEERERTKRIVYASLYGAGPRKLADILGVEYPAALDVARSFGRQFPCVRSFGLAVAAGARAEGGRVTSLLGRVRRLPGVTSHDPNTRAHAERQALNFVIQGSAADVCKSAMVVATRALRAAGLRARLLLSVHDELVWEIADQDLDQAAEVIRGTMEQSGARAGLPRLPVALSVGRSWGQLQPYAPTTPPPPPPHSHSHPAPQH